MFNHEPPGYVCPLCEIINGADNEPPWTTQADVVYRDDTIIVWVNPKWWGDIEGNVVVIPTAHVENIFDLSDDLAAAVHRVARQIAVAMKETYGCPGVSTRQHNGPEGNQDAWHYHLHVFPRYRTDDLYGASAEVVPPVRRAPYADKLRAWFEAR